MGATSGRPAGMAGEAAAENFRPRVLGISASRGLIRSGREGPPVAGRATRRCVAEIGRAARRGLATAVRAGAGDYTRATVLPRLIPIGPDELADDSREGRRRILALLARALRSERRRGRAGHWSYDLNRHIGLKQAMVAEAAGMPRAEAGGRTP